MNRDDIPGYKTIGHALDALGQEVRLFESSEAVCDGNWVYDKLLCTVRHTKSGYEVPLDEIRDAASALGWIQQLAEKQPEWIPDEDLGRFVRLVHRIFSARLFGCLGNRPPV